MRLRVQNIGIIDTADINIDGITVITGKNDSGKSTVGKVLYSIIRALNNDDSSFNEEKFHFIDAKIDEIFNILARAKYSNKNDSLTISDIIKFFFENKMNKFKKDYDDVFLDLFLIKVNEKIQKISNLSLKETILKINQEIESKKNISIDSTQFLNFELTEYFKLEFGNQISNFFLDKKSFAEINTNIDTSLFAINDNKVSLEKKPRNFPYKNVLFIESPLFLNKKRADFSFNSLRDKRNHLNYSINKKEISKDIFSDNSDKTQHLKKLIQEVIGGDFSYNEKDEIIFNKNGHNFSLNNVATGLKTFGAIQLLIDNGSLNTDTLLIIDEPEVHLHPTWQVKFAEILVRLSKEFAIPMILTSHSPYFIEALEAYSIKYHFEDSTDFYFAQKDEKGESSKIININNNLNIVLDSISEAYYTLQDIKDEI
ncbi:AAA family ATPase [Tenacibaculum finnmarkense genomovar finnmarkense]|uniref:AAA family ATPase n=1 Tax=Tenacibaculum finnmarkense TaxID=2781243 RepID=UPI001E51BA81|nr:AAA family ATPase [Tenacibaculum finnmarkense]MCD8416521.1 AAA family ATPase [Tenacibaculum finnmarkense genomovar finnmarkense]MCG8185278.1 AAA family ATPase [Tenacibaculum finnmarkense genomovar finnmarkense]MCG8201455.1 AAA family ATPase [Tenacibaculum finnmarkense genomovar finnmarkense]MCG8209220.1 AAA family ATPase [Tenacibaculum finnmarkense genomovar finnmarkense]MCG8212015.1 AAA family ATPase [Tenacibaculum finnmarkense genomovar finnmarkense]